MSVPKMAAQDLDRPLAMPDRRGRALGAAATDLQEAVSRFETAFASAPIGMALVSIQGRWLEVNDAFCQIVGHPEDELRRTTLQALVHPEDVDRDERAFQDLLAGRVPSYQTEKRYRDASGRYVWLGLTVSMVRDRRGEPLYVVTQIQDISERKDAASRLEYLVDHDLLTGLYNRQHFQREVTREAERMSRHGAQSAVLMIDLDNFKKVNDTFGHKAGDDFLRGIAGVLRQRGRHTDVLARVGGDEFAMLLSDTDAGEARVVAEGIVKVLGRQVAVLGEQSIPMTASVGGAVFDGLRAVDVLEFADLAMYEAKEAGRNRFAMNETGAAHPGQVSRRTEVELIRTALDEDRMLLYCQPILDLKTNQVCQYEALVRLQTGVGSEPLLPSSFLYVAERFNLIQEIDCWVAQRAIELIAEYGRAGQRLVLHVNLSGKSIGDARVAACIEEAISRAGIDPACLVVELTETTAITNIEDAKTFAHRLHARGCGLALDDFGAGFGSFSYLKSLPFDYVKIDGDFIHGLATSPMDQLVVQAIVGIARGLGKKTIAEFVPDEVTGRLLEKSGVDFAQGYHVGPARPVREILPLRG